MDQGGREKLEKCPPASTGTKILFSQAGFGHF